MAQRNQTPRHSARSASQRSGRSRAQNARPARPARGATSRPSARGQAARQGRHGAHAPRTKAGRGTGGTVKQGLGSATYMPGPNATIGGGRPSAASQAPDARINISLPAGESLSITRRQLLIGALGVGAVVVAGAAASAVSSEKKADSEVDALAVNKESVFSISDCTTLDAAPFSLVGEFKMPYGTLVWANSETYAACLLPTENSSPLTQVAVLSLSSGQYSVVLDGPQSTERGFDIYDVRCNDQGIIGIESNCFTGEWRVFQSTLSRGVVGDAKQVDSGNSDWDIPSITVAKSRAFWQVMPSTSGEATSEPSALKSAAFGSNDVRVDWESNGRMSTSPYSTGDAICTGFFLIFAAHAYRRRIGRHARIAHVASVDAPTRGRIRERAILVHVRLHLHLWRRARKPWNLRAR